MALTLEQLNESKDSIDDAMGSGALKVVYGDPPKQVTLKSTASLREARNVVVRQIAALENRRKPRKLHISTPRNGWQE